MDIYEKGLLIPILEYEVYNIETNEKLNLNICNSIKIDINIPVKIDENSLFKYNSSSEYYNDICYSYTTENKTDIILKDRRKEYFDNNLSLCENNCTYKGYNNNTKKVLCECYIKIKFPLVSEIIINKDKLLNNFIDIKNTININVMKCFYTLFTREGLIKNIGNYILIIIIIFSIILCILFRMKGYYKLKKDIDEIVIKNKIVYGDKEKLINYKNNNNNENHLNIKKRKRNEKKNIYKITDSISNKSKLKLSLKNSKKTYIESSQKNILYNSYKKILKKKEKILNNNKLNINDNNNFNDYEINNLNYNDAIQFDKRTYFQYYFSLLKTKHIIIFSFYTYNDYNSKIIKINLLLFSFSLYLTINSLFFNDATMHKIYEDQGSFDFIYQIPKIIYSSMISSIINLTIKYFSLSEKNILEIKKEKNNIIKKKENVLIYLLKKFIIFFILLFIFLIIFWYYISCFCAVYKNTQIYLIKDTLTSFSLSLLYPFILNLLLGLFRIPSLKYINRECLYKSSKLIQLI